jgi:Arc/MetJ family transcription regulator
MRTTVTIDDDLYRLAREYAPESTPKELFNEALREYIRRRSFDAIANMHGSIPEGGELPPRGRL